MTEIPKGYCQCGCGQKTNLATRNNPKRGYIKGEPTFFLPGHCFKTIDTKGRNSPTWKGGRYINDSGYVCISCPDHPRANMGYVREHVLVMEKALGRYILSTEAVHHIDGNRQNNFLGNLMLFRFQGQHVAYHYRLKAFEVCGHYDWRKCSFCQQYDHPDNLYIRGDNELVRHRHCANKYKKEWYARRKG